MNFSVFTFNAKNANSQSLDHTLFKKVTVVACVVAFLATIVNFLTQLYVTSLGTGVAAIIFLVCHLTIKKYELYLKLRRLVIVLIIASYCLFWITNAGSQSNMVILAFPILLVLIICFPSKERIFWLISAVAIFIAMYVIEYYFPEIIVVTYPSRAIRFLDLSITLTFFSLTTTYFMQIVKHRFDLEKALVEKQNHSLVTANESLVKLERFMDNANDAIQVSDFTGRLIYANKVALERLGLKKEELSSVHVKDFEKRFRTEEDWRQHVNELLKVGKIVFEGVNSHKRKGVSFPVEVSISIHEIIDEKYVVAVSRDISERKAFEQQQAETIQELKKANSELDNFIYRVSHDLRAPLTSTLGLNSILKEETNKETQQEYIALQEKSLKKLDNFILDILSYSRNSRLAVTYHEIDLEVTIQQIFENLEHHNQSQVDVSVEQQVRCPFISDSIRIEMILGNLISNAFKFQNPREKHQKLSVSVIVNQEKATIKIADNGIGIGKEYQDKIFEMFYRATDINYGSGLGLYIVKEAVDFLQGTIKLDSIEGKGTTFYITVPNHLQ